MMNSCNFIGRLTADPKVYESDGVSRVQFCLAVDKNGVWDKEKNNVDFFDFVAWRGVGEYIAKRFHKGDLAGVEDATAGAKEYIDSNGNKHRKYEFTVSRAYLLSKKRQVDISVDEEEIIA